MTCKRYQCLIKIKNTYHTDIKENGRKADQLEYHSMEWYSSGALDSKRTTPEVYKSKKNKNKK